MMTRLMVQDTRSGEIYVVDPDAETMSVALHYTEQREMLEDYYLDNELVADYNDPQRWRVLRQSPPSPGHDQEKI